MTNIKAGEVSPQFSVQIECDFFDPPISTGFVERLAHATFALLLEPNNRATLPVGYQAVLRSDTRKVELSILLCTDSKILELNRDYRQKPKKTDVLSFPQLSEEMLHSDRALSTFPVVVLGDIVISLDTTVRQAEEFKVSVEQECTRLLVHGLLHLLGFEHEGVASERAAQMFSLQDKLYAALTNELPY